MLGFRILDVPSYGISVKMNAFVPYSYVVVKNQFMAKLHVESHPFVSPKAHHSNFDNDSCSYNTNDLVIFK